MKNKIVILLIYMILLTTICPTTIYAKEKHSNKEYQNFDITVQNKVYYYKEKRIRIFQDIKSDKSFVKSFVDNKGTIDIRILRDNDNKIKKVKHISKKKANKILKSFV